jgi:small-conductance mechanosensitive channel
MTNDLEIKLLKESVFALREELEKNCFEEGEHIQHAVAGANDEIRQLRASIVELRDQLELQEAEHDEKVRSLKLQHDRETADLHRTVAALRQKLEELNESLKQTHGQAKSTAASPSR